MNLSNKIIFLFYISILLFCVQQPLNGQIKNVYISEIMYDSPLDEDKISYPLKHNNGEYLKLYNPTDKDIDMSSWVLKGTGATEQYVFPSGTKIMANDILLLAYKSDISFDFYQFSGLSSTVKVLYQKAVILNNRGESLKLYNSLGSLVDIVSYGDKTINGGDLKARNGIGDIKFNNLKSLKRTKVSYKNDSVISNGINDLTYGNVSPSITGNATEYNATPIVVIPGVNKDNEKDPIIPYNTIPEKPQPITWFQTVPVTASDPEGKYMWRDITGNNAQLRQYDTSNINNGSEYITARANIMHFNFHPALNLSIDKAIKEILINKSNLSQATIIGIWQPKEISLSENQFLYALNGRKNESVVFTKENITESNESGKSPLTYGTSDTTKNLMYRSDSWDVSLIKYHEQSLRIASYSRSNHPEHALWGESQRAVISLGWKYNSTSINNTSTFGSNVVNLKEYDGYVPELLIFDRILSLVEQKKVESYLAIKYGITMDKPYISGNGELLWDTKSNIEYQNRVTGYGHDDTFGLNQIVSTTSYEESPYFSETNGTYYQNNINNLSTDNRLLVIGCQPGNQLGNGEYVLYGDNNKSYLNTAPNPLKPDFGGIVERKWLVCTNKPEHEENLDWTIYNITITNINQSKYKYYITKPTVKALSYMITKVPLKSTSGFIGWTVSSITGTFTVKFGTNNGILLAGNNDYGYKIANGLVYPVKKGVADAQSFTTLSMGQTIGVYKEGNKMYMRVDGVRNSSSEITMLTQDSLVYGSVNMAGSPDISMNNLRHGGFVNSGNRIELSYDSQRASELATYADGKCCLIIDRSGTGNFDGSIDRYVSDEYDATRRKIIFNNVFWDTDGNGKDVFTFGYLNNETPPKTVKKPQTPTMILRATRCWQYIIKIYTICRPSP